MSRKALTYFELDVPYCANTFGSAPCTASISNDPFRKCFNTKKTCQDRPNFVESTVTLRFAIDADYLPKSIDIVAPNITSVSYRPAEISLGETLGIRASVEVSFEDHRHPDTGAGFDKYLADRDYNPFTQGSFWGKFRARQPYLRGCDCRLIMGFLGDALEQMETRHFIVDSFTGPGTDGVFSITAKDVLKLADDDRAQAPALSGGSLSADLSSGATSCTLIPTGTGDEEYNDAGYLALGGKEIVSYTRSATGNDVNALAMMHFDGANNATSTSDSSASARTVTRQGDAKLVTAEKVYGTASGYFDGTGDHWTMADAAAWTFAGDFTLEARAMFESLTSACTLLCHSTDINNMYRLFVTATGKLRFEVVSASVTTIALESAAGLIETDEWYHLAVVRSGNDFALYIDGESVATGTDSDSIPNFTGTFKVGMSGNGSSDAMHGWMDEVRVSNVARWSAAFALPRAPYGANGDALTIARAQFNTTAIAHSASDRVQLCVVFTAADPADIIADLLIDYAGVNPDYIPRTTWQEESAQYLGRVYTACIPEPVGVNTLLCELIQQTASWMHWDDLTRLLRWQVIRTISTDADIFDEEVIEAGTLRTQEQQDLRISRVWFYFAQRNPLEPLENETNYRAALVYPDPDTEADYGSSVIKKIYSRWIPQFGVTIAERASDIILGRYKNPPRKVALELFRSEGRIAPQPGSGYLLEDRSLQDATGARESVPIQITMVRPSDDRFEVEAQEALFASDAVIDLNNRVVVIDSDVYNKNLRTLHDTLYPVITDATGITLRLIIAEGVKVGSTSQALPALDIGSWLSLPAITVENRGRISGAGGRGSCTYSGNAGTTGGPALKTRVAIDLENVDGELWGGGGGGGGYLAGGGGGAGRVPGAGGVDIGSILVGASGTETAGGVGAFGGGGSPPAAGAGGGPGLTGSSDTAEPALAPGFAAGAAIDGISYTTVISAGDKRGLEIN